MTSHVVCSETAKAIAERKTVDLSLRRLAVELGYAPSYCATLSAAARRIPGAMSRAAENDLRQRLGLPVRQSPYKSVALPAALRDGLNEQRKAHGLTWAELLSTLETS
jgi:cyanate lyase